MSDPQLLEASLRPPEEPIDAKTVVVGLTFAAILVANLTTNRTAGAQMCLTDAP